jgi:hypothetical protein
MGKPVRRILRGALLVGVSFLSGGVLGPILFTAGMADIVSGVGMAISPARGLNGLTAFDPKSINVDKTTPRKIVFGRTAFPLDLRYGEPSADSKQEYIEYVFALAAHKSDGIESLYIEETLAWTLAGGAQGIYAGYLWIEVILEGGAGSYHTVNAGTKWGSSQRMTGCTTMKVRVKRSANSSSSQSPFASGISGRWTLIGRGMPVYDPALDSTVAGGSGSQLANDNSTWAYTASGVARGNNPALQLLAYLLGWKINGIGSVGLGIDPARLNLPSFAAAAAICDESIALDAGGTQRRYESGKAYTDGDDPSPVIYELLAAMNGELVHDGGQLALRLAVNDLTAEVALGEDDFLSGFEWRPVPELQAQYTVVRGRFTQPDAPALFGMVDYPDVATGRTASAPRVLPLELPPVQNIHRAERIARQVARRSIYSGEFTVTVGIRGWLLRQNMVVSVTSPSRGWTNRLFRVRGIVLTTDGSGNVDVRLREENAAIYAWAAEETGSVAPVAPIPFDPANGNLAGAPAGTFVAGVPAEELAAGGSPAIVRGLTAIGSSTPIEKLVRDGSTLGAEAQLTLDSTSGAASTTLTFSQEARPKGGTWVTLTGSTETDTMSIPDGTALLSAGAYTNSSGQDQIVEFRTVSSLSGGAAGVVNQTYSYQKV